MGKKYALILIVLLAACPAAARAADGKPVYKWVSANEYYFILPAPQDIYFPGNKDTEVAHPWGLGVRAVGNGERFSRTGALQLQSVKISGRNLPEANSFYILDLLLGLEYMTPKVQDKTLRFTASAVGDIGLSNTDFFLAPVLSAGFLYTTDQAAETPTGLTFSVFYRPTDIALSDVGSGTKATLRPALGVKLGYIFEGFWTTKEKN